MASLKILGTSIVVMSFEPIDTVICPIKSFALLKKATITFSQVSYRSNSMKYIATEYELKKLKLFLFQENLRINAEKQRLEEEKKELKRLQEDFMKDRVSLRDELNELNRRTSQERQRLKQENLFFDKKMEILKDSQFYHKIPHPTTPVALGLQYKGIVVK